jgi:phosphatidylserine/phosphatidylglycerophosphate/cardiolipin synthase-like enzyme
MKILSKFIIVLIITLLLIGSVYFIEKISKTAIITSYIPITYTTTVYTTIHQISSITITETIIISATYKPYITAYFSPKGGCEKAIIEWINRANKSIHIMMYSFTLDSISDALILAHSKGIEILIIFEREQISKYSEDIKLKNAGINIRYDNNPALMHNKVMIIDNKVVLTGSFNWSSQAEEENNENLLIIIDNELAELYEKEFQKIWNEGA